MSDTQGWCPDPGDPSKMRYWTGSEWSGERDWTGSEWVETVPRPAALPDPPAAGPGVARTGQPPLVAPSPIANSGPGTPKRKVNGWLVATVIVACAVVGAGVALVLTRHHANSNAALATTSTTNPGGLSTTSTSSPRTSTTDPAVVESAQVRAVAVIVSQSVADRTSIGGAISSIESCGDLQSAVTTLQADATSRQTLATRAGALDVSSIPNGSEVTANLAQAMSSSAASDRNYAAWAQGVEAAGSCSGSPPQDANWSAAQQTDAQATAAKTAFVAVWNPIAQQYGLVTVQPNQL